MRARGGSFWADRLVGLLSCSQSGLSWDPLATHPPDVEVWVLLPRGPPRSGLVGLVAVGRGADSVPPVQDWGSADWAADRRGKVVPVSPANATAWPRSFCSGCVRRAGLLAGKSCLRMRRVHAACGASAKPTVVVPSQLCLVVNRERIRPGFARPSGHTRSLRMSCSAAHSSMHTPIPSSWVSNVGGEPLVRKKAQRQSQASCAKLLSRGTAHAVERTSPGVRSAPGMGA